MRFSLIFRAYDPSDDIQTKLVTVEAEHGEAAARLGRDLETMFPRFVFVKADKLEVPDVSKS